MRKINKLFITPLLFGLTACVSPSPKDTPILASGGAGQGGNPEVNLNQCFGLKNQARQRCFDIFYPGDINLSIYPSGGKVIRLAGRRSLIETGDFNLTGKDRFIFYLDISKVKLPIDCNVKSAKLSRYGESLVVDVETKNIENNITLTDREGKVILNYNIVK